MDFRVVELKSLGRRVALQARVVGFGASGAGFQGCLGTGTQLVDTVVETMSLSRSPL